MIVIAASALNIKTHGNPRKTVPELKSYTIQYFSESNKKPLQTQRTGCDFNITTAADQTTLLQHSINHMDCLSDNAVILPLSE